MSIELKDTGDLSKKSAFSILYHGICHNFSGVYVFASGKEKYSLVIQDGVLKTPIAVVDEATIGKYFFDMKKISDDIFMKVKKIQTEYKIPFFQALLQSNVVNFADVQSFITQEMAKILDKIFSWKQGKYIIVEQVPKDIVPVEIQQKFYPYLFYCRYEFHVKHATKVQDVNLAFNAHKILSFDDLLLNPQQLKILQTLKKTKTIRNLSQLTTIDEKQCHAFVRSCLDFELIQLEKSKVSDEEKKKIYKNFNFEHIYNNYQDLTFYEMLGLGKDVNIRDVAPQYFEIAKHYHPDRFKEVDQFQKPKVEKVFARITEAYQTLSKQASRKAYDDKLAGKVEKQIDVERVLESENAFLDGMEALRRGQFDKAVSCFKHAITLYSEEYEFKIRLGWAQYRLGLKNDDKKLVKEGKEILIEATQKDRALDDVFYYQGMISKNDGEYEKAKTYFSKSLDVNKNHIQSGQELRAVQMLLEKRGSNKKGWF
ncbi:MAG: DnaJ domain-containing protein [Bdellovibrionales bacterium]|nr:DnaJ domain-containing protein [Bdellovibrionales bacterium]